MGHLSPDRSIRTDTHGVDGADEAKYEAYNLARPRSTQVLERFALMHGPQNDSDEGKQRASNRQGASYFRRNHLLAGGKQGRHDKRAEYHKEGHHLKHTNVWMNLRKLAHNDARCTTKAFTALR